MTMTQLLHEIAAHMATTPPAALGPLLWGGGLLLALRRLQRRPRPAPPVVQMADDELRPAA